MAQTVVVVTFYSRGGDTEKLATAAAVGAVQARAGIRMRRVAELDVERTCERYPECREHIERMLREYVPPKEADLVAADALIVGSPPDVSATSDEWSPYFAMLERLKADGRVTGKMATVVGTGATRDAMATALAALGLTVVTPPSQPEGDPVVQSVALGRQLVAVAESRGVAARP